MSSYAGECPETGPVLARKLRFCRGREKDETTTRSRGKKAPLRSRHDQNGKDGLVKARKESQGKRYHECVGRKRGGAGGGGDPPDTTKSDPRVEISRKGGGGHHSGEKKLTGRCRARPHQTPPQNSRW